MTELRKTLKRGDWSTFFTKIKGRFSKIIMF
jgi:hypothetical protein